MGQVDLHMHSTVSDGRLTPEELVREAAGRGLTHIALADHDSVDGIVPALAAARDFPGLTVIPAIELSTDVKGGEVHILGYFIDFRDEGLAATLIRLRNSRRERARKMVARLADLGVVVEWQRVQEIAGDGAIGRPHVAQAVVEGGYVSSSREAFDRYIGRGGPAYVEREKITPVEAVIIILAARGLPVLAHPFTAQGIEELVAGLREAGLAGIEAYYVDYSAAEVGQLVDLAARYDLITTGGSDFHGPGSSVETVMGEAPVPLAAAEHLIALAGERGLKLT